MAAPKMNVAICGGGIAGIVTALAISKFSAERKDIKVDVYEAYPDFTEIGAGVGLWPRPWRVLEKLGVAVELEKLLEDPPTEFPPRCAFEMRKSDQADGVTFYEMIVPRGPVGFQRSRLLDVISQHLDPEIVTTHFSKRLKSYSQDDATGTVKMVFTDGAEATADALIGSDGLHSTTRKVLLEAAASEAEASGDDTGKLEAAKLRDVIEPVWCGMTTHRAVVSRESIEPKVPGFRALSRPILYCGKDKNVIAYPIAHGKLINIAAAIQDPSMNGTKHEGPMTGACSGTELRQKYEGWEDEVQKLLECVDKFLFWKVNRTKGLPISTYGRAALLGDAAHAMAPSQGSGAGQAIEDAYVLAILLAHPKATKTTLPTVLNIYEKIRLPFANEVLWRSEAATSLGSFGTPEIADLTGKNPDGSQKVPDAGRLWEMGHALLDNWKWAWTTSIEDDAAKAIDLLEATVGVDG